MEQEPTPLPEKLTTAVAIDYPAASEILVSFPNKWELVHQIRRLDNSPLYIAGMPPRQGGHGATTSTVFRLRSIWN